MEEYRKYSVYKGLQRPIVFKGLKGNFIYYGFGIAGVSLVVMVIGNLVASIVVGTVSMLIFLIGGLLGMAIYQRKYGLYRKSIDKGIYIVYNLFNKS